MTTLYFILFAFLAVLAALAVYQRHREARRRRALFAWAFVNRLDFSPGRDHRLDRRFPRFDCLGEGHNRYGYNVIQGTWRGRPMVGFDYHYETYSRDSKGRRTTSHHHFSAVVVTSEVELKPLVVRPESALDRVAAFFGSDDIDFESAEFSRKFFVKSPDRRWAYHVIHPRTMEFLLAAPRFTIEMEGREVIAYRRSLFAGPEEFEAAAEVVHGILDRLPRYLVKMQGDSPR